MEHPVINGRVQTQGLNLLELCQKGPLELYVCEFRKATVGDSKIRNPRLLRQIRQVEDDPGGDTEDSLEGIQVVKQTGGKLPPLKISLQVDECEIPMEINIGASISVISEGTYRKI